MKVLCISCSNIEVAREHSASTRACELVGELLAESHLPELQVEILPLIDYDLLPCRMCGGCLKAGKCARDEAFNAVFDRMLGADALFLAVPHYAPIPSKVMILLEKLEEMAFLNWCQDTAYRFPLSEKPVGLIAHGGQSTPEALPYYKTALLDPLAGAFSSVGMRPVGAGEGWPNGVVFGVRDIVKRTDSIFVDIEHDWEAVRERIRPLVTSVMLEVQRKGLGGKRG
jgi:multimeric flavodoxin WrbA